MQKVTKAAKTLEAAENKALDAVSAIAELHVACIEAMDAVGVHFTKRPAIMGELSALNEAAAGMVAALAGVHAEAKALADAHGASAPSTRSGGGNKVDPPADP